MKQSYESISSEQHLKEYELSTQRQKLMKHEPASMSPSNALTHIPETPKSNHGDPYGHHFNSSFGSMASLSMTDIQGNYSRNMSLHSLSPSLDGAESVISKHRTKSGTIKGSGLKLLTDDVTLNKYLDGGNNNNSQRSVVKSNSVGLQHKKKNRSMSTSKTLSTQPMNGKYSHYSAFKSIRNNSSRNNIGRRNKQKQHYNHSSISSNVSHRSLYNYPRHKKDNGSIGSMSELSSVGNDNPRLDTIMSHEEKSAAVVHVHDENVDENEVESKSETLSNDILSFFAM